jgi:hypothetical protein
MRERTSSPSTQRRVISVVQPFPTFRARVMTHSRAGRMHAANHDRAALGETRYRGLVLEGLFFLADLLFGASLVAGKADEESQKAGRRRAVRSVLTRVADELPGRYREPWLRAPRVEAFVEGRPVTVIWRGRGVAEVRLPAPPDLSLKGGPPSALRRLLGRSDPVVTGDERAGAPWLELLRAGDCERFSLFGGELRAFVRADLDAARLVRLVRAVIAATWREARSPDVVVRQREPAPAVEAAPSPDLRCPFCHDALGAKAVVVRCDACAAPHHPTCFEEGGGCAIAGCRNREARGNRVPTR